ncbi:MAG: trypsin-like serine peptidase [Longimicrobiales bacterium]
MSTRKTDPTKKKWTPRNPRMSEVYMDDVEDAFEGTVAAEPEAPPAQEFTPPLVTPPEELTEPEDLEDHDAVSSTQALAGIELDTEAPEVGDKAESVVTTPDMEIEPVPGYDTSLLDTDREELGERMDESRLLDAWYAEYGDPTTIALLMQQPAHARETIAEVVIGTDDRIRIANTTAYPWRCICSLRITAKDGSRWIGTGWLVGPRTVVTAGHVVFIHSRGGWVQNIEVIPGRDAGNSPFGSCFSTNFRSVKGWTQKKKSSHDYGAIILPRECGFGNGLGYFGYANLGYFSLFNLKVNLGGYPGDKSPAGSLWWHARRIKFVTSRRLIYNIDTAGGQSGSPVWRLKDGKRHVVGIHTNGSMAGNSATRIAKPVFNNIKSWKAEGS